MTDWALRDVPVRPSDAILDIGCGGGRTVHKLATRASEGTVFGVDYAEASVAMSRRTNADAIASGRVRIEHGSVAALPFAERTFDLVTAVETHYYWPDLAACFGEIRRVLKPGGRFVLVAETYRGARFNVLYAVVMRLLRAAYLTPAEHQALLAQAGFTDVTTTHGPNTNWIRVTGRRAEP